MAGRWKVGNNGQPEWEEGVNGPNQIAPPQGQEGGPGGGQSPSYGMAPGTDWGANTGYAGGQNQGQLQQGQATPWSNSDEANFGQTWDRFNKDYWAPDRDQVLAQMRQWSTEHPSYDGSGITGGMNTGGATPAQSYAPGSIPQGGWQATAGWDTNKLNDPNKHDAKYDWLRAVQLAGGNKDLNKVVDIYNQIGQPYGQSASYSGSGDKVKFSGGNENGLVDVLLDQEGKRGDLWLPVGDGSDGGGANSLAAGGSGLTGLLGGSSGIGGTSSGGGLIPGLTDRNNYLWSILNGRQGQSLAIDPKDPIIANQVNAYRAEQERGLRNQLDQAAESQGPMANLDMERRMGNESVAQNTGNMQSQLMQNELTARRQEIQNALSQMGGMLSQDQQLALQRELGLIDANLRQQGINNQNSQFLDQMGMNYWDRNNYWDALRSGLIGG